MITRERWERARPVLEAARRLAPADVPHYLDRACAGDAPLRRDVELLLAAVREGAAAYPFLDAPAAELAVPLVQAAIAGEEADGELLPGLTVGPYTIERRLGRGGMGVVYVARETRLDRKVALKLLPPWLPASDAANRRFVQEAQAASRLDHPNIETVYGVGETGDGRLYIAMPYYEGETLQAKVARGPLDVRTALRLARQIAAGLEAAHAAGIVHRDVKPSNVVVTRGEVAKIVDFGAATTEGPAPSGGGRAYGTVAYMSPEQAAGSPLDARTDVWSFGVMLYEMLAGTRPFRGADARALTAAIRNDQPEPLQRVRPGVPPRVAALVHRCLAKDPAERYPSGRELRRELEILRSSRMWTGRRASAAGLAALVVVSLLLTLIFNLTASRGAAVEGPAAAIAVMPARALDGDSALTRLGRELAVTLSANLDGMGGIRTLPALTVLAQTTQPELSLTDGARIARELGATSVIHGTLVRSGADVRLDFGLYAADTEQPIASATATGPLGDVTALTDSMTMSLLRRVWRRGDAPVANLAALTTGSPAALRAYLEGELAFARAEFSQAVPAFERAFAADSTFALAYWRSLYPRIYEGSRPDTAIVTSILAHRDRLADPERLLVDASAAETASERIRTLRLVTSRFSEYWPGWYAYADALFHIGPYAGTTQGDALAAMERVVALNPDFAVAWQHLLWIAVIHRDTSAADRAIAALDRFAAPGSFMYHPDNMTYFHALHGLLRSGGAFTGDEGAQLARVAASGSRRVPPPEVSAVELQRQGFPRAQLQQADATLRGRMGPGFAAAQWMGKSFAWATRGDWDSALASARVWVRVSDDASTALRAYGLAVLGARGGGVRSEVARRWRPDSTGAPAAERAEWTAELAWLDGVLAHAEGDVDGITAAHQRVVAGGAPHAELLAASLDAFRRHASGAVGEAAGMLASLERRFADESAWRTTARAHPYLSAVHRPAAARWLTESGDTLHALRLLPWHEAVLAGGGDRTVTRINAANGVAAPLALFERARLETALGRTDDARRHYRGFLERYDRPPAAHEAMVAEARAALGR